jgi:phosphoglycolate phosphatase
MNESEKIILFDFDGVLINTLDVCWGINTEVNENLSKEEYKSFFEGNIYDAVRHDGSKRNRHPDFFTLYSERTRHLEVPELLISIVKKLSQTFILCVVSSTDTSSIKEHLKKAGLAEFFLDVLGADFHTSKVHKIEHLLEKYKKYPQDALFITDTVGDIREAKKCGVESIAVSWGFHEKEKLEKENSFVIVDTPEELLMNIEKFFATL